MIRTKLIKWKIGWSLEGGWCGSTSFFPSNIKEDSHCFIYTIINHILGHHLYILFFIKTKTRIKKRDRFSLGLALSFSLVHLQSNFGLKHWMNMDYFFSFGHFVPLIWPLFLLTTWPTININKKCEVHWCFLRIY